MSRPRLPIDEKARRGTLRPLREARRAAADAARTAGSPEADPAGAAELSDLAARIGQLESEIARARVAVERTGHVYTTMDRQGNVRPRQTPGAIQLDRLQRQLLGLLKLRSRAVARIARAPAMPPGPPPGGPREAAEEVRLIERWRLPHERVGDASDFFPQLLPPLDDDDDA